MEGDESIVSDNNSSEAAGDITSTENSSEAAGDSTSTENSSAAAGDSTSSENSSAAGTGEQGSDTAGNSSEAAGDITSTENSSAAAGDSTSSENSSAAGTGEPGADTAGNSSAAAGDITSTENSSAAAGDSTSTENSSEAADSESAAAESESSAESSPEEETLLETMAVTEVSVADGYYRIASAVNTKYVMDIAGGKATDGANAQIYTSNNSPAQVYKITAVAADGKTRYRIVPVSAAAKGVTADAAALNGAASANVMQKTLSDAASQLWYFSEGTNGGYRIHSALSHEETTGDTTTSYEYVLEVAGGAAKNSANVRAANANGGKEQEWILTKVGGGAVADGLYTLRSRTAKGKVMDIYGNKLTNNANVQIYKSNGTAAQKFWLERRSDGYYRIRGYASGMAMDVENKVYADGTNIQLYKVKNTDAQKYVLEDTGATVSGRPVIFIKTVQGQYVEPSGTNVQLGSEGGFWLLETAAEGQLVKNGLYTIRTALKKTMVVDIYGGRRTAGTKADIYTANNTNAQMFRLTYTEGGTTMQAQQSGMYLTNTNGTVKNLNKVTQQSGTGTAALWKIVPTGDGTGSYYIQYAANTNFQLDVKGAKKKNGTAVDIYAANGSKAQKWYFDKTKFSKGWQYCLGKYRYVYNSSGSYYTNREVDGYMVGADGTRESTQDRAVRLACKSVTDSVGKELYSVYKWCVDNIEYVKDDSTIPSGYSLYQAYVVYAIENHKGNCYHHACTFCALARYCGYDAHVVEGVVPAAAGGVTAHAWVEIDIGGSTYVFDTQFEHQYDGERNGYYFTYGTSGTWVYQNYKRMN